ncbi:hypothetical protein KRR38_12245 [Novosphingobium sp. G106]|uniref:hypothetical protein n=1 Tax=Novosphingobium sp. G106 TaxID=2849500 RepID=UPI001C2D4B97|nr:hypothetical protein [Novosphingobium sp. G106]MBV1688424.1 hypothetical protein [Novosphingobium sp. G106]
MANSFPRIVRSDLSRSVTLDDLTVKVDISRFVHHREWVLKVFTEDGMVTIWDDSFVSEVEALAVFQSAVQEEGIASFFGHNGTETVH